MISAEHDDSPIGATRLLFRNGVLSPMGGITDCGFIKNGNGITTGERTLDQFALVYLAHGYGTFSDHRGEADIAAGDLILLFPGVPHWYGPKKGQAFDTLHAVFQGPAFDLWWTLDLISPDRPIVHRTPIQYWLESFERALGAGNGGNPQQGLREVLDLERFMLRSFLPANDGFGQDWASKAKEAISQLGEPRLAAQALGMSYDSFRRRFSAVVGSSPGRYRQELRVDAACELLATTDLPVYSIAHQIGFADELYFSRAFKNIVGESPRTFRLRYR